MADSINLGQLVVQIAADVSKLRQGEAESKKLLDGLAKQSQQTSRQVQSAFAGIATRLGAVVGGFLSAQKALQTFQSAIADQTALQNLSQSTGIAVRDLDSLRVVAAENGVEFTTLQGVLNNFGSRMTAAISNPTSEAGQALRALNLDLRNADGSMRTFDQLLPQMADKFASWSDGMNKSTIAAKLFSQEAGPGMSRFLSQGSQAIQQSRAAADQYHQALDPEVLRQYQREVARLEAVWRSLGVELSSLAAGPAADLIRMFTQFIQIMRGTFLENRSIGELGADLARFQQKAADLRAEIERGKIDWGAWLNLTETKAELEAVEAQIAKIEARIRTVMSGPEGGSVGKGGPQAPPIDQEQFKEATFQLDMFMQRIMGSRTLVDEMNFAWSDHASRVEEAMKRVSAAYGNSAEAQRKMSQLKHQMALKEQSDIESVAATAATTLTSVFQGSKLAAIGAAIINTSLGITRAFAQLNPPWSWIQAGLIAATGAAQIANIRSTNEKGGGSAPTVSGSGGEQETEQSQSQQSIFIQGVDPGALYSGKALEELFSSLNNATQNGATLISTRNLRT